MVAESAARKRAEAAGTDPNDEPEVIEATRVVSMAGYLSRRVDGGGGFGRARHRYRASRRGIGSDS